MGIEIHFDESRIRALRDEAAIAGDFAQVSLCDQALEGNELAMRACLIALALADARAQVAS